MDKLTAENRHLNFEKACWDGVLPTETHHIIPRHHGGGEEKSNKIEVDLYDHALLHKKIWLETECKECRRNYKSLMGKYNRWKIKTKLYNDTDTGTNETDWYRLENNDILKDYTSNGIDENYESTLFEHPEQMIDTLTNEMLLDMLLDTLSEREADIIKRHYGIGEHAGKHYSVHYRKGVRLLGQSINDIGEVYDLTRERVRQVKEKAIKRLRGRVIGKDRRVKSWLSNG